ncbi:MAG: hypothetical protein JOZ73_02460 [Solirubrobacterales bacterium]|nr:hypothetical protein [Solirubrobacterales bacterium]
MKHRTLTCIAAAVLLTTVTGSPIPIAIAAPRTLQVSASLNVTAGPPPACHVSVCTIRNHGTGHMTHFGNVTFTTVITADGNHAPCGPKSQWVDHIVRTIHTIKGNLVLHEAGLQCPQPSVGPRVDAVWVVDGTDSTGIFAGAHGRGNDTAYPLQDTATPHGKITLAS